MLDHSVRRSTRAIAVPHEQEEVNVSARTKLNVAFINGAVLLAAVVGVIMASWSVFFIALVVFVMVSIFAGEIRPSRSNRRGRRGRR